MLFGYDGIEVMEEGRRVKFDGRSAVPSFSIMRHLMMKIDKK